jgi:hypothetical protein
MKISSLIFPALLISCLLAGTSLPAQESWSGIYPHLAMFNDEGECGTGAVVPWADRLWVVTYAPHMPKGSSDKLYEITADLQQTVRSESIGGTPANRMIHRESQQLFIGPYVIDATGKVRVIPYTEMFGRPTGTARHLFDPAGKVYTATMEEGIYEIDVNSLAVTKLWADEADKSEGRKADLPGYHGKGFYEGQGRLIYANNGDHAREALVDPTVPSGVLAEWDGRADAWTVVRRAQFTEVTGPGGIYGSEHPESDSVWCVGWDAKSLLLMVLFEGAWHTWRLPKASHSYDGAHGWNTEWPRIRDIGEEDLLMTMHGMFWRFPRNFSPKNSAGIVPRSTYLKVIGDFSRWQDRIVLGCDDTAKNEFLNKRKAKGEIAGPQSQSNLWFLEPDQLDQIGPVIARGAVWLDDEVAANSPSDPYLFAGIKGRALHLSKSKGPAQQVTLEVDAQGDGQWTTMQTINLPESGYVWTAFPEDAAGVWIRLKLERDSKGVTAWFTGGETAGSTEPSTEMFDGLARIGDTTVSGGIVRARDKNRRNLHFAARNEAETLGAYELTEAMVLQPAADPAEFAWLAEHAAIPDRAGVLDQDDASLVYTDEKGRRFRLPRGNAAFDAAGPLGPERLCREVSTERDLFNCHGTFFELPAENAGGFARVRPVATHDLRIADYCSYRGLLVLSGVRRDAPTESHHIIHSSDGKTALWVGAIDDIWKLGKPTGHGGPWLDSKVEAGVPSDAYLMTGYDQKSLILRSSVATEIAAEIDISGFGHWQTWRTVSVGGETGEHSYEFPEQFQAYWIRFTSAAAATVTAQLEYR